ncbi:hypothetical protein ACFC09_07990 [Streptomyces sp. NPDC056161]|uniref:hypothetical protein n=1 Tax=Streptomyces sp. NPDC056161 TaxID=3345732 RepID=UPI0035D562DB
MRIHLPVGLVHVQSGDMPRRTPFDLRLYEPGGSFLPGAFLEVQCVLHDRCAVDGALSLWRVLRGGCGVVDAVYVQRVRDRCALLRQPFCSALLVVVLGRHMGFAFLRAFG